jgi:hypothetical protein
LFLNVVLFKKEIKMKKNILSLVVVTLIATFAGLALATGGGIHNGTSYKFPQQQHPVFKADGGFWGGSDGIAKANGSGDVVESGTFSVGKSEGGFDANFNGKNLDVKGDIHVAQEAGAFNTAKGVNYASSHTRSHINGGGGINGSGHVGGEKQKPNDHHDNGGHNDHDNNHHHGNNHHGDDHKD